MARRRLTPAQPGYLEPEIPPLETKAMPFGPARRASVPPIAQVSGQSAEAAALRELAEGIKAAQREGRLIVEISLGEVAPGHLVRDRVALDREELDALKASIRTHGQRTPAEITLLGEGNEEGHSPYRFGLISGWRRLRALSELYEETGEARFATIRALMRPEAEAAGSYIAMVEENEIRAGLSYYERARVVAETTRRGVFADQGEALRALFATASRAKRSKIASFIDIHEELGEFLHFPAEIPERLGLQLVARLRAGEGKRIRAALGPTPPASASAELALLEKLARPPRTDVSRAKPEAEVIAPGVTMALARKGRVITLTLAGDSVDEALVERLRETVRGLA
jgi:ParB family chromosome partitioning protein